MCGRAGGRYKTIALRENFVVAAFAATKFGPAHFPRAERGAKFVQRAFARDGGADVAPYLHGLSG